MTDSIDDIVFPETPWSLVAKGAEGDDDSAEALRELLQAYWQPVYCMIRDGWQYEPVRSQILCEQFLSGLMVGKSLQKAQNLGVRFRDYLKDALMQFMEAEVPDEFVNSTVINVDVDLAPGVLGDEPEVVFDKVWAQLIFENALQRVQTQYGVDSKQFALFQEVDIEGGRFSPGDPDTAQGLREVRMSLRRALLEEVHLYVATQNEACEELSWLIRSSA